MLTVFRGAVALVASLWLLGGCSSTALDNTDGGQKAEGPAITCSYGATSYPAGATFPSSDGCNSCSCAANGQIACTLRACVDAHIAVDPICNLDRTYTFSYDGGLRAYSDLSTLTPARTHQISRDLHMNAAPETCSRELDCTADSASNPGTDAIMAALRHPDVVTALQSATTPPRIYGTDPRPYDGSVLWFRRDDGQGFMIGDGAAVPAGLSALETVLGDVAGRTLASPACANLPTPGR